ncbi:hypothetical protein LCER1_G008824 [Lachnellula cervina]|uniref:Uncharacterized protein n=1 Tax=Lachnellula cervina TaxID=1316786 RepID=A0A7D8Z372_9HELO|nr:hypothetical protein LCER1_G008824 [Lachnellula cervina]
MSGLSLSNNKASNNSIRSKRPMSTALVLSIYNIDIVDLMRPLGPKGEKYFITITNRSSRGA